MADHCDMPFVPIYHLTYKQPLPSDLPLVSELSASAAHKAFQIPSPIGQPTFGVRVGLAQADAAAYFGGLDVSIPLNTGIRLISFRADGDVWKDISGRSRGGTAVSACALFGPKASYFGGGLTYASRYGGASGPSGAGIKLIYGSQLLLAIGYELNFITTSKGSVAAIMVGFHA